MQSVLKGDRIVEGIVPCPDGHVREWVLQPAESLSLNDTNNFFAKMPGATLRYEDLAGKNLTNGLRIMEDCLDPIQLEELLWCLSHHSMRFLTETHAHWLATMDTCIEVCGSDPVEFGQQIRVLRSGVKFQTPGDEKWDEIGALVLPVYKEMRKLGYSRHDLEP